MIINVQASHDKKFPLEVEASDSAVELKGKISTVQNVPAEEMRLIFSGRILKDADTVESLKMAEGNTLHLVRSAKAPKSTASAPGTTPTNAPSNVPPTNPSFGPSNPPGLGELNPETLAQMMGGGGGGFPAAGDMASMMNNPAMQSMMSDPNMMRQTMEMMMANPQLLQSLLQMNPAYQNAPPQVQQMMQRPEFLRMILEMSVNMPPPSGQTMPNTTGMGANEQQFSQYMQTIEALMGPAATTAAPASPVSNEPPEVRFASQLQQLTDMGFYDPEANIRALLATGGNVHLAIERLLQNM